MSLAGLFCLLCHKRFHRRICRFFMSGLALDNESLLDVRELEIVVEFGCGPYFADFVNPAVIRG